MEEEVKGRGCILASVRELDSEDDVESPEAWRALLQLPEAYEIEQVCLSEPTSIVLIYVRHAQIPVVAEDEPFPYVCPVYRRDEAGKTSLLRIDIQQYTEAEGWHSVAVSDELTA